MKKPKSAGNVLREFEAKLRKLTKAAREVMDLLPYIEQQITDEEAKKLVPRPESQLIDDIVTRVVRAGGVHDLRSVLKRIEMPNSVWLREQQAKSGVRTSADHHRIKDDLAKYQIQEAVGLIQRVRSGGGLAALTVDAWNISPEWQSRMFSLPELTNLEAKKQWAGLMAELLLDADIKRAPAEDPKQTGGIADDLDGSALRLATKRKGRSQKRFFNRYRMTPFMFLALSHSDMTTVKDHLARDPEKRRELGVRAEATRIKAQEIEDMKPERGDFVEALREQILSRLKTGFGDHP